ncbi:MAG: CBS domain-containing protein, partial [Deltaproteobacteria bacterium]|nr:CBS domain-containing protein [Deltaproteobacteria bacterium]
SEAIKELNKKNIGAVLITREKQKLAGIITDGDLRRAILQYDRLDSMKVEEIMTTGPKAISADMLAADALSIMQRHEITVLPIVDTKKNIKGILHLHDLLGKGEFKFLV